MRRSGTLWPLAVVVAAVAGCATQQQVLDTRQDGAIQTALQRGRFELNCPAATGVVLSRDYLNPVVQGPWVGAGITRIEYTIGIEGCNQRKTYIVICQEGSDFCFAANPENR